jgi:hypothetical protein
MKDDKGLYYYPFPENKRVRKYVTRMANDICFRMWDTDQPELWGFESYRIERSLKIEPDHSGRFPVNVDGSTMICRYSATFQIVDHINLISK